MKQKDPKKYIGRDLEAMSFAENYYAWLIDEIKPYLGKEILEVGAGHGTFTEYLLKTRPSLVHCIEPSIQTHQELVERYRKNKKIKSYQGTLSDHTNALQSSITSAVYINVMEHVKDDFSEFQLAYDALKPGGYLIVYVPALQAIYGEFDAKVGHYRRYSKGRLLDLCQKTGFTIHRLHYSDIYGIIPWFINFRLLKKEDLNPTAVRLYDRYIVPFIRNTERFVKPPIGKNLWLIAQKP